MATPEQDAVASRYYKTALGYANHAAPNICTLLTDDDVVDAAHLGLTEAVFSHASASKKEFCRVLRNTINCRLIDIARTIQNTRATSETRTRRAHNDQTEPLGWDVIYVPCHRSDMSVEDKTDLWDFFEWAVHHSSPEFQRCLVATFGPDIDTSMTRMDSAIDAGLAFGQYVAVRRRALQLLRDRYKTRS